MASLLIIGGSGFFGKSILDAYKRGLLSSWGITAIKVLARNASDLSLSNPELNNDSIELINADIGTCNFLPGADYVIHAASSTDAAKYLKRPKIERENIQSAAYNYCRLAPKFHSKSKIIYCSSGAVYGQQPAELLEIPENFELRLLGGLHKTKRDYAAAKRDSEQAIRALGKLGLDVSIARCFAFIGVYLPRDKHFAIGNFIQDGMSGRPINVEATLPVYRSYMHADDLVHWLMKICYFSNPLCPTYNVGSNHAVTIGDLAALIAEKCCVGVNKAEVKQGGIDRYIPSIDLANNQLGLRLSIDLADAITKTIESIRARDLDF